jgi:hypothetical protein
MQHSAFKDRGESVDIFAQSNKPDSLTMFKILEDDTMVDMTPASPVIDTLSTNLKKSTVTLPTEHSTVVSFLNEEPVFMRVGAPKIRFTFFAGRTQTGLTIPYEMVNQTDGSSIESGNLMEYGQGLYGFNPVNTGDAIIKCKGLVFPLRVPYTVDAAGMQGSIYLQKNAWMMLAVPKENAKIYEDFIQPIETQSGLTATDLFEVFNAYPYTEGPNGSSRQFLSFVPGVTNPASSNNFQLIYEDLAGEKEISGFWVKTKDYAGDTITFNWDATT